MNADKEDYVSPKDVFRFSIMWGVICFGIFLTSLVAITTISHWFIIVSCISLFISGGFFRDAAARLFEELKRE